MLRGVLETRELNPEIAVSRKAQMSPSRQSEETSFCGERDELDRQLENR